MSSSLDFYTQTINIKRKARREGPGIIQDVQRQRLLEMVSYARQNSRFYAEKYVGLPANVEDVSMLPVVSKPELMPRLMDWITDPDIHKPDLDAFIADPENIGHLFMDKYLACTTSGTTGQPAVLLQDQATLTLMGALNIFRAMPAWITMKQLGQIIGSGMRTAAVWATGGHYLGIAMMKRQIQQKPARARSMRIFSVLTPLSEIVAGLNSFKPAMLNGYASAILLLAQEQAAGRLDIHPVLVLTSSESLAPEDRQFVQNTFGCAVADNYGCSEFVAIAAGCREGWLHVNSDWVILEPVDENLAPAIAGVPSHSVLLTNLVNRVQPILRYNLGDRITVRPDACPCGSPFPAIRVEGRTDDILYFQNGAAEKIPVLPLALWATVKQTSGVDKFQAIQRSPLHLEIRLDAHDGKRDDVWPVVQSRILSFLASQNLANVAVSLSEQPTQRDPRSGKFRHVWAEPT